MKEEEIGFVDPGIALNLDNKVAFLKRQMKQIEEQKKYKAKKKEEETE